MTAFAHPFLSGLFGDKEVAALLSAEAEIRAMLEFEAALAEAEGKVGVIPKSAAARIAKTARSLSVDPRRLASGVARDGVVVPTFVARLREAVGGEAASFVHWGATSQDVIDTALVLNLRKALDLLDKRITDVAKRLAMLAARHRKTPIASRTRGQQAAITSFGLKAAGWLSPLTRQRRRLGELRPRALALSFGGASGNLAALGTKALKVEAALARGLRLPVPPTPWHTQRDGFAEVAGWLVTLTDGLGKLGGDLLLLSQSEVGEVRLASGGSSSTLPNKANPVAAETLVTLARYNAAQVAGVHHAALQEHERGGTGWQLEWLILPAMAVAAGAALRHAEKAISGLGVDKARMRANIEASNGLLLAEAAGFALSAKMPRGEAQALVKEACAETLESGEHLCDVLARNSRVRVDWDALRDPARQLGAADAFIDRVIAAAKC
ncbi:MAG: 3-carboxy-cis,cis-muconate cycloisomerase [Kiloniellales bacterium]